MGRDPIERNFTVCLEEGEEAKWLEQFAEVGTEREGGKLEWGQVEMVLNSGLRT